MSGGAGFSYAPLLPAGDDLTDYRLVTDEGVDVVNGPGGRRFLTVDRAALTQLTAEAMHDIAHYLRPAHLAQLLGRADGDLEVEVVVGGVRLRLAQVPRVADRAQQRAGDAVSEQRLLVHGRDAAQPLQDDLVLHQQREELVDALRHRLRERPDLL